MQVNNIIRVVRPHLELINQLRSRDNRPVLGLGERPEAIRNVVVADDEYHLVKILTRIIGDQVKYLSGKPVNIASLSAIPAVGKDPYVFTAVTMDETALVIDHVLDPKMKVDMLFTDFNLLGITGQKITQELRGNGYNGYIIGVTAGGQSNSALFYEANADLVLRKPFDNDMIKTMFTDLPLSWISKGAQKYALWLTAPEKAIRLSIVHGYRPRVGFNPNLRAMLIIEYILSDPSFEVRFTKEEIDDLFRNGLLAKDKNITGSLDEYLADIGFWSHVINNKLTPVISAIQEIEALLRSQTAPGLLQSTLDEILPELEANLRDLKIIEDWIYHNAHFLLEVVEDWKAQNSEVQS